MLKHYFISVGFTFFVGFVLGMYLYFAGFSAIFSGRTVPEGNNPNPIEIGEFVVVGDAYGGCAMAGHCPSFQVSSDGSYHFLSFARGDERQNLNKGNLPKSLLSDLEDALSVSNLSEQAKPINRNDCTSFVDGIDYTYHITLDGVRYVLDSCGTNVNENSDIWQVLTAIWSYLESN